MVKKYHSNIKSLMFSKYSRLGHENNNLDIGTGKGGDITKMRRFNKVFVVEPNRSYINELKKRQKKFKIKNLVIDKNPIRGQETDKIKKLIKDTPINTITMMNSLTFFYNPQRNFENLEKLLETLNLIQQGGYVMIMAADGKKFYNLIKENNEYNAKKIYKNLIDNFFVEWDVKKMNKIHIKFGGAATLEDQKEWLIDFDNFIGKMNQNKFSVVDDFYLNSNLLVKEPWKTFTDSYRFIVFRKDLVDLRKVSIISSTIRKRAITSFLEYNKAKILDLSLGRNLYRLGVLTDKGYCLFYVLYELLSSHYRTLEMRDKTVFIEEELKKFEKLLTPNKYFFLDNGNVSRKAYGVFDKQKILLQIISDYNAEGDESQLLDDIKNKLKPNSGDDILNEIIDDIGNEIDNTDPEFIRKTILRMSFLQRKIFVSKSS